MLPAHTDSEQTHPAHTYDDAIAHLNSLVPELFTVPVPAGEKPKRRKFSLDQISILTAALGNPQTKFPSVLIAGTNGKGSTASTLASIATASGLRTGLYTSPHLERVNERIKISPIQKINIFQETGIGTPANAGAAGLASETWATSFLAEIPDQTFARLYFHVLSTAQRLIEETQLPGLPSYFELLTAIAFCCFAEPEPGSPPVDLAILEVGMGGQIGRAHV